MSSRLRQYIAIHPDPSLCSSTPGMGRGSLRFRGPMLSRPRNPPSNRLLPSASLRFTHHAKLMSSLWNTRARKSRSVEPSIWNTRTAAHAWTGGLASPNSHSYAGSWPFGWVYHSRSSSRSWRLASTGSRWAMVTQWKARSHDANQGYSHVSGMRITSLASTWRHAALRPWARDGGGGGWPGSPRSHRSTSNR